jgi:hypothetical protein
MTASHPCPVQLGAGGLISAEWCFDRFRGVLATLPPELTEADVSRRELLLYPNEPGPLEIYYAPVDSVNRSAKVVIVGITPGRKQAAMALREARRAIADGVEDLEAIRLGAKNPAAFAGPMWANLVAMLDGIGVADELGIESTSDLWAGARHFLSSTSAVIYPVFVRGQNYTGSRPRLLDVRILAAFVDQVLRATLELAPDALIVPLGTRVDEAVASLRLEKRRYLRGFPHLSPANGWRLQIYERNRDSLAASVREWFA